MKREINRIVVHCAATPPSMDIGVEEIRKWHVKGNGWADIGYHYVIRRNGLVEVGRKNEVQGAHAKGYNVDSLGVCLVGGIDEFDKPEANFTFAQYLSLVELLEELQDKYGHDIDIRGHKDLPGVTKSCPCFDVRSLMKGLE